MKKQVTVADVDLEIFEALALAEGLKVRHLLEGAISAFANQLRDESPELVEITRVVRRARRVKELGWTVLEGER